MADDDTPAGDVPRSPEEHPSYDLRLITKFRVVVHANAGTPGLDYKPSKLNHWSIFFLLDDGGSLRMGMRTLKDSLQGDIFWEKLPHQISYSTIKSWDWEVKGADGFRGLECREGQWVPKEGICPTGVEDLIWDQLHHRYMMHESGQGSRYWIWTTFNLLVQRGWIEPNDDQDLKSILEHFYPSNGAKPSESKMVEGRYTDVEFLGKTSFYAREKYVAEEEFDAEEE